MPRACLGWDALAELRDDPLATIGNHTNEHLTLAKARPAIAQIQTGIRDATSAGPREFAIAAELGIAKALTTRPGVLFAHHLYRYF